MSIICVANSKGGTGKTSLSLNLIHHLNPDLIIDADVHKGISSLLSLGDNEIEVRHAKTKQDIINWTKSDKLILIDCGGFDSDITRYAISQADKIITPTTDDPTDQFGLVEFDKTMKAVSQMVDEKLTALVVLNRVHHSRSEFNDLDKLIDSMEHLSRSPVIIPQSALIPKAAFNGKAVLSGTVASKFLILSKAISKYKS